MDGWLKKVEEMKKQRSQTNLVAPQPTTAGSSSSASVSSTPAKTTTVTSPPSTTTTSGPTIGKSATLRNPFLSKTTSSSGTTTSSDTSSTPASTTSAVPSKTVTSPPAKSSNPFLAKMQGASTTTSAATSPSTTTSPPATSTPATTTTTSLSQSMTDRRPTATSKAATLTPSTTDGVGGGIYKIKFEAESKRRAELETEISAKNNEIEDLKEQLRKFKLKGSDPTTAAARSEARKTKRMTRANRQTQMMSVSVINTIDVVLQQIGGLDKRIRASEAARMQAEDKLMEIAIAKLEVDEVIQKVDTILKKLLDQYERFSSSQVKEMLTKIRSQTQSEEEGGNSRASIRFSIIVPKGGLDLSDVAPAPPPPGPMAPTTSPKANPPRLGLLDQIRQGTSLRNLDITKLRQEQQEFREKAKETIGNMGSLEDVLRSALSSRLTDMNLYEEESDDEDWQEN
eukprot:TRINITY_DN10237_c0_g1_i1.p1 TRINITY_DN10237_c0_g1~~TRINITY_DN10237_c0_g1_i1.p1  ORF type:complete len:471 (+),score=168.72 TRINITY_DN10237_c0_g1_i1:51-1415(+)